MCPKRTKSDEEWEKKENEIHKVKIHLKYATSIDDDVSTMITATTREIQKKKKNQAHTTAIQRGKKRIG